MLEAKPFCNWNFTEEINNWLLEERKFVDFIEDGIEVIASSSDLIKTIFIHYDNNKRHFKHGLVEIPLTSNRSYINSLMGKATSEGSRSISKILGKSGAWQRFDKATFSVHIEFDYEMPDVIRLITLMLNDGEVNDIKPLTVSTSQEKEFSQSLSRIP
jgi:hypothetical protein